MAGAEASSATPAGVRDGDPAALAALTMERGPAVLAYAHAVLAPDLALQAAAEAFARFRAALVALGEVPEGIDPAALLLGAVRRSVATLTPPAPPGRLGARRACGQVPVLVAARLEGELSHEDDEKLRRHLARDEACRAIEQRFLAAERAFADPPPHVPSASVTAAIVGALAAAGPEAAAFGAPPVQAEPEAPKPEPEPERATEPPVEGPAVAHTPAHAPPPEPERATEPPAEDPDVAHAAQDPAAAGSPGPPAFARPRRHRPMTGDHGLVRTVLAPLGIVGVGAILAMAIAGVFDDEEPVAVPTQPPLTAPAEPIPAAPRPRPTPAPDPPPVVRGNGQGEDVLGQGGVPGPGTAAERPAAVTPQAELEAPENPAETDDPEAAG